MLFSSITLIVTGRRTTAHARDNLIWMLLHVSRHLTHPGRSKVFLFVDSYVWVAYPPSVLCSDGNAYSCDRRSVLHVSVFHKFKLRSLHINKLQNSLWTNSFVVGNIDASWRCSVSLHILLGYFLVVGEYLHGFVSVLLVVLSGS